MDGEGASQITSLMVSYKMYMCKDNLSVFLIQRLSIFYLALVGTNYLFPKDPNQELGQYQYQLVDAFHFYKYFLHLLL